MSRPPKKNERVLRVPIMYAFRDAFENKDSAKREDRRERGERIISKRGSLGRFGVDDRQMRRTLSDDLTNLVNTIDLGSVEDIDDLPRVRRSILNFGLPDITHLTSEDTRVDEIATNLRDALLAHEPRLDRDSIQVSRGRADDLEQRIRFTVDAEMLSRPVNVPVEFVAEVDIHSGKVQVSRLSGEA